MSSTYQVFAFVPDAAATPVTPVESLLSALPETFEVVRVSERQVASSAVLVDTGISRCGRHGCTDCTFTQKARPVNSDYELFRAAASRWNGVSGAILVKAATTVAHVGVSAANIAEILSTAISAAGSGGAPMDAFYLSKWLDRADQWTTLAVLSGGGKIVRTWNPHGIQAIAFTKVGFEKILSAYPPASNPVVCRPFSQVLNSLIQRGTLVALTTTPSLLQYDASRVSLAVSSSSSLTADAAFSYLKTCETRGDTQPERLLTRRVSADLSLFWAVIVIVTAVVAVWVLVWIRAVTIVGL